MKKPKCGAQYLGRWTGITYTCALTYPHLHHKGYNGEDEMEWPNYEKYCSKSFPGTDDVCKRPPKHIGYCRVKVHGQVIRFKNKTYR